MTFARKDKTILVDCDGVLFDWEYAFASFMDRHGYVARDDAWSIYKINEKYGIERAEGKKMVRIFNESAQIRRLPPLRDAVKYVQKLHIEHGYVFHAITSLSLDPYAQHLRTKNIRELFGTTAFEKYVYLDTGADKDDALAEYQDTGCYWVEDKPENADTGTYYGLKSMVIAHGYNSNHDYKHGDPIRVQNWKEIYDIVTGNQA